MKSIDTFIENLKTFFNDTLLNNYLVLILELIMFWVVFYFIFKLLKNNKVGVFIFLNVLCIVYGGFTFALAGFDTNIFVLIIFMYTLLVFTMFHTEIKRVFFDKNIRRHKASNMEASEVSNIMDEICRAVQSMSKKYVGALIVLSNENLPEGIIETGTVIDAKITAQAIESVFYPKAPLHDGALIIEGVRAYAAGCFLPLSQSESLPKEMGSRHRAAIGVTTVASVTAIVVSEETGIVSIVKNGAVKKKFADTADIKNALSDYYWSELTAEGKL